MGVLTSSGEQTTWLTVVYLNHTAKRHFLGLFRYNSKETDNQMCQMFEKVREREK